MNSMKMSYCFFVMVVAACGGSSQDPGVDAQLVAVDSQIDTQVDAAVVPLDGTYAATWTDLTTPSCAASNSSNFPRPALTLTSTVDAEPTSLSMGTWKGMFPNGPLLSTTTMMMVIEPTHGLFIPWNPDSGPDAPVDGWTRYDATLGRTPSGWEGDIQWHAGSTCTLWHVILIH